jgi:hypothetical protein
MGTVSKTSVYVDLTPGMVLHHDVVAVDHCEPSELPVSTPS